METNVNIELCDLIIEYMCQSLTSLPYHIHLTLNSLKKSQLQEIVSLQRNGCAPLFWACKNGNVETVNYLLDYCNADIEQKGIFHVPDDQSSHFVTPLWCAAVAGHLSVVKTLVKHGANINSVSNTGSTPVRSACFMSHHEIVYYLVECGADIMLPNFNGGTCLINSVQSVSLCKFLLSRGANVNAQDIQLKTALLYAIQEHRLETTLLLLEYGANPTLCSRTNDDALQTACLKGAIHIFNHLVTLNCYSKERIADAYELMGSYCINELHDVQTALYFWKEALVIRTFYNLEKQILLPSPVYENVLEFTTVSELDSLIADINLTSIQSLLIYERILGGFHKDFIFRLMYHGAAYLDNFHYHRCCNLWLYALSLRISKDTLLYSEVNFAAQALLRLFFHLLPKPGESFRECIKFEHVYKMLEMFISYVPEALCLLKFRPIFKRQEEVFDQVLHIIIHLICLLSLIELCPEEKYKVTCLLYKLVKYNPCASNGDSLLHLAVSKSSVIQGRTRYEEITYLARFPNNEVVKILLDCGFPVDLVNNSLSTPLLVASFKECFDIEIVKTLLEHGAHIDVVNIFGSRPYYLLMNSAVDIMQYTSLQCLSARIISQHKLRYQGQVPFFLENFIELH